MDLEGLSEDKRLNMEQFEDHQVVRLQDNALPALWGNGAVDENRRAEATDVWRQSDLYLGLKDNLSL